MSDFAAQDDITHILLDARGSITFRCNGFCMFPLLRPGDSITVEARGIENIAVGDIAVFRRNGLLVAHRVVHISEQDGVPCLVTRADRALRDEPPVHAPDLLGIVARTQRRGCEVSLSPHAPFSRHRYFVELHLACSRLASSAFRLMTGILCMLQDSRMYRLVARSVVSRGRMAMTLRVPLLQRVDYLYRDYALPDFPETVLREASTWSIVLTRNGAPAATLTVARDAEHSDTWWIRNVATRLRFRGMRLEDRLLAAAETCLSRLNAARLCISLSEFPAWRRTAGQQGFFAIPGKTTILEKLLRKDVCHDE